MDIFLTQHIFFLHKIFYNKKSTNSFKIINKNDGIILVKINEFGIINCSWLLVIQYYFLIQIFSQEYYLSNCMFPPLASTSWTEMLMPLLLFANEMLLVTHEFDLKYNTNKVKPPSISLYEVLQKKKFIISPRGSRKIK